MLKEFREFISRGNVLDLAVGVVIGAAFAIGACRAIAVGATAMVATGVVVLGHALSFSLRKGIRRSTKGEGGCFDQSARLRRDVPRKGRGAGLAGPSLSGRGSA